MGYTYKYKMDVVQHPDTAKCLHTIYSDFMDTFGWVANCVLDHLLLKISPYNLDCVCDEDYCFGKKLRAFTKRWPDAEFLFWSVGEDCFDSCDPQRDITLMVYKNGEKTADYTPVGSL